jgi:hypothetical protein
VRFTEPDAEKERVLRGFVRIQGFQSGVADNPVYERVIGNVLAFGSLSLEGNDCAVFRGSVSPLVFSTIIVKRFYRPRRGIFHWRSASVVDLSYGTSMVAVVFEVLRECHQVRKGLSEMGGEVPNPDRVGSTSREQRKSRRPAYS